MPYIKYNISEIKFDKEFDILVSYVNKITTTTYLYSNNYNTKNNIFTSEYDNYYNIFKKNKKIYIDFNSTNENISIGITVKNNNGPGVKITNLIKNKMAINSGLSVNDVILFINNISCTNHKNFINILENYRSTNKKVCCILQDIIE